MMTYLSIIRLTTYNDYRAVKHYDAIYRAGLLVD